METGIADPDPFKSLEVGGQIRIRDRNTNADPGGVN
jgi:hypothetical protein